MKALLRSCSIALLLSLSPFVLAQEVAPININTASAELLAELPGIGEIKASAIVENRQANGAFSSVDDLARVKGIGENTIDKLRDQIEL
ncbi:ComEA family DNA-binding protein [Pistricoccus aurantiacus]|uniref:ComEA family DNA-binding protein n=1 Tax=Pistricoccus aurantiacus TaxID=1883414 RepID=UPI003631C11C